VAWIDYDNSGWLSIYLVSGSTYDAGKRQGRASQGRAFRNNHDSTFTNVAEQAGVTNDRWGVGVAICRL